MRDGTETQTAEARQESDLFDSLVTVGPTTLDGVPLEEPAGAPDASAEARSADETGQEPSTDAAAPEPAQEPEKPKIDKRTREGRKASIQEEIDSLTATKYATRREVEAAQAQLAELRRDLTALDSRTPPTAPGDGSPQPASVTKADWQRYLDMPEAPKLEAFDSYDQWNAAVAVFIADQRYDEREAQRQQRDTERARAHTFQERLAAARTKMPDFDSRVKPHTPLSAPMRDLIIESPLGPELLVYLSDHPDDAQRLATLHPIQVIRDMAKLEGRLEAAVTGPAPQASTISHAKPPIKPVGSSPVATSDGLDVTDDLPVEEHIRRMNAREARSRR